MENHAPPTPDATQPAHLASPLSPRAIPLWVQLAGTLLLLTAVVAYMGGEIIRNVESDRLFERAQMRVEQQLALVCTRAAEVLANPSTGALEQPLNALLDTITTLIPDVDRVEITDAQAGSLAAWYRPGADTNNLVMLSSEIRQGTQVLGELNAGWDAGQTMVMVEKDVADVRINIFLTMLVTTAVLMLWIRLLINRPLNHIQRSLTQPPNNRELIVPWWVASEFQQLKHVVEHLDDVTSSNDELEREMERRKEAEVELVKVRDQAMEANHAKSVFLANMSHELRTPLNAIIGYSEIMEEEVRSNAHPEYAADLEKIQSAGRHLLELINEVLDLSKIEAGKMDLYLEVFNLSYVVDAVVKTVQPMLLKNGNMIHVEGLNTIPVMKADVTKVRQILYNLLSNAIKFTEHGQIVLTANKKMTNGIDGVEIKVIDSGIGMDLDDIDHLFIPFQQADVSTTRKYGGTGLGLALCRRLCDMMQGHIRVNSEPGKGSTFSVWLPLEVMDATHAMQNIMPMSKERVDPKKVRLPDDVMRHLHHDERRKKIATVLTIDDDPNVLDLMARVYQREGFRPVSAINGKMGLDLARKLRPDLITLDIMMPEMDGWTVLKALKEDPEVKDIPVIMVSIVENKPMALDVGALDSLTKPIAWDRLVDLTRDVVRKKSS